MTDIKDIGGVPVHPAANIFPMIVGAPYRELVEDIRANGVRTVLKFIGESWETAQILDGRNRLSAIQELRLDYRDFSECIHPEDMPDPVGYVLSLNKLRRHLSEVQLGIAAGKAANLPRGANQYESKVDMSVDTSTSDGPPTPAITIEEAAKAVGTSRPNAARGKAVATNGIPNLQEACEQSKLSMTAAAKIAKLPKEEQAAALAEALKPKPPRAKAPRKKAEPVNTKDKAQEAAVEESQEKTVTTKTPPVPTPLMALKALSEEMTHSEGMLVAQFAEWVRDQSSIDTIHAGAVWWIENQ